MSSATTSSSVTYYGVGFLGIFSIASYFSIAKLWERFANGRENSVDRMQRHIDTLNQALERREAEMNQLRGDLAAAAEAMRQREKTWEKDRKEIEEECKDLERRRQEASEQNTVLAESLQAYTQEVQLAKEEVARLRSLKEELETSTSAMREQTFPAGTNRISDTDVTFMVAGLNGDILRTAQLLTEFFESESRDRMQGLGEDALLEGAIDFTKEILGDRMTDMLSGFNHREVVLLQIAFQASICAYSEWITTSWVYRDRDDEQMIQEIYDRLREREEQPISSRWRVLTRKYVRQVFRHTPQVDLSDYFFDAFANILVTAGLQNSGTLGELTDQLKTHFASHIADIINRAIKLNNVIGDDITSCELVPINCETGILFDEDSMENTFDPPSWSNSFTEENILCTTELGLLRSEKVHGKEGEWTHLILLKPKVVLQSAFRTVSPVSDH
ncbi:hypothetical protein E1B28_010429 [Marasmius oreades]|uniref:Uncharacterized protein n=1 Tax=Marasmius oreades TaxID=181124 RepID=A0A9P7RX57_9AGAR|nr:uncharacterized protein E1B28_010429 [Marasmius oreades]KAG7091391.1 hypothetical protein E1B28_010429 [Marasmius oreades]